MKTQKICFTALMISTMLSTAVLAQEGQRIDPDQLKWLHGRWKGVGFERSNVSSAYGNPVEKPAEFTLSYDSSTQVLTLTSQRQIITREIDRNSEYQHYDYREKRIELYELGKGYDLLEERLFRTKLLIEFVSDGHIIFSLVYNRRADNESFIASGALMLAK
jgi:hypothetical protein